MGLGGIHIGSLLIILLIIVLLFGTKRLRNIGKDLGSAVKSFRSGLQEDGSAEKTSPEATGTQQINHQEKTND